MPIIPSTPASNSLVKQVAAVASVNPYPGLTLALDPCSSKYESIFLFNSPVKISPPLITASIQFKSFFFNFCFNNASYNVGTPTKKLGLVVLIILPNFLALNLGSKIHFIPHNSGV